MDVQASDSRTTIHVAKKFITMEPAAPEATAVAVRNGRIVAVGSLVEVQQALGDGAFDIDDTFEDMVVSAGFIDQHLHPMLGATTLVTEVIAPEAWELPDRTFDAAVTPEEYTSRLIAADASFSDPTEPLMSWGYHPLWHGALDRARLDAVSTTRPICVWHRSCHEFFMNTAATDALGLTEEAMQGQGRASEMVDWEGGHWWETGAMLILGKIVKGYFTPERLREGLVQMVDYLHSKGVTALNEPGIAPGEPWDLYEEILGADSTPLLSTFLVDARSQADSGMDPADAVADAARQVAKAPEGKVRMVDKQVKLFSDGAIISQMMQMKDPYLDAEGNPDPDHHGEWLMDPEVFTNYAKAYWEAGWQLHIHVNGDAGLDLVLDTLDECLRLHPRNDHRTVIVHFANSTEEQVDRIADLGAIVSANPYYPVGFADKYGEVGLGPERADAMVRSASVLRKKIPLSFHSDLPMAPSDPMKWASYAVNRLTQSGRVAGPDQRISLDDALRAMTIEAAYSWQMEDELGSIAAGKAANFTVLLDDPYDVDPTDLDKVRVAGVMYEGRWFPVENSAGAGATASIGSGPVAAVPWSGGVTAHDHAGCSCETARAVATAVAEVLRAA